MKTTLITLALALTATAVPTWGHKGWKGKHGKDVFTFTSTYNVIATPDQVVSNVSVPTGGLPGAMGYFNYGINSVDDVICYNITLNGFQGGYVSPANTATHIHQAPKGKAGPPRLAFPNPLGDGPTRNSVGCLKGPFKTGVKVAGSTTADTGDGFTVKMIEDDPAAFFTDVHSTLAVAGAVRGQLSKDC